MVTVLVCALLTFAILTIIPLIISVCLMVWDEVRDYRRRNRSLK